MADNDQNQNNGNDGGGDDAADNTADRLFRREGIVSDVDLRVDVAAELSQSITEDEVVELDYKRVKIRGDASFVRGSRDRTVKGTHDRSVDNAETRAIGDFLGETVHGGVHYHAAQDVDIIMGGAYFNTIAGAYLRIAAWTDFLAWGGWLEVDVGRAEISAVMIRSHMFYMHNAGARVTLARTLIDDFVMRYELFGVRSKTYGTDLNIGAPGSGVDFEA